MSRQNISMNDNSGHTKHINNNGMLAIRSDLPDTLSPIKHTETA